MPTIYSTLSNDRSFPKYEAKPEGAKGVTKNRYKSSILIKGGANVADKHFQTKGVAETEVSAEDLKTLQENSSFKRLVQRGFMSTSKPKDAKKDGSAPKTEDELKAKAGKKGVKVELNTENPGE